MNGPKTHHWIGMIILGIGAIAFFWSFAWGLEVARSGNHITENYGGENIFRYAFAGNKIITNTNLLLSIMFVGLIFSGIGIKIFEKEH